MSSRGRPRNFLGTVLIEETQRVARVNRTRCKKHPVWLQYFTTEGPDGDLFELPLSEVDELATRWKALGESFVGRQVVVPWELLVKLDVRASRQARDQQDPISMHGIVKAFDFECRSKDWYGPFNIELDDADDDVWLDYHELLNVLVHDDRQGSVPAGPDSAAAADEDKEEGTASGAAPPAPAGQGASAGAAPPAPAGRGHSAGVRDDVNNHPGRYESAQFAPGPYGGGFSAPYGGGYYGGLYYGLHPGYPLPPHLGQPGPYYPGYPLPPHLGQPGPYYPGYPLPPQPGVFYGHPGPYHPAAFQQPGPYHPAAFQQPGPELRGESDVQDVEDVEEGRGVSQKSKEATQEDENKIRELFDHLQRIVESSSSMPSQSCHVQVRKLHAKMGNRAVCAWKGIYDHAEDHVPLMHEPTKPRAKRRQLEVAASSVGEVSPAASTLRTLDLSLHPTSVESTLTADARQAEKTMSKSKKAAEDDEGEEDEEDVGKSKAARGYTKNLFLPWEALLEIRRQATTTRDAGGLVSQYHVCRICNQNMGCCMPSAGVHACLSCLAHTYNKSTPGFCRGCCERYRLHEVERDYSKSFVCTLMKPLQYKLHPYSVKITGEFRTLGSNPDATREKRVDLFVEAKNGANTVNIFVEHVTTAEMTRDSFRVKKEALIRRSTGASSVKSVFLVIYNEPGRGMLQLVLLRTWITMFIEEAARLVGGNDIKLVAFNLGKSQTKAAKDLAGALQYPWNAVPYDRDHEFRFFVHHLERGHIEKIGREKAPGQNERGSDGKVPSIGTRLQNVDYLTVFK